MTCLRDHPLMGFGYDPDEMVSSVRAFLKPVVSAPRLVFEVTHDKRHCLSFLCLWHPVG